jgi:hypothetical protein
MTETLQIDTNIPAPVPSLRRRHKALRHPEIPLEKLQPGHSVFVPVQTQTDPKGLATSWLRERIGKFRRRNPRIEIHTEVTTENNMLGRRIWRLS